MIAVQGSSIRFQDVTLGYDRRPAVHHFSGTFAPGSLTAVVGPNGAGKSTLLKGIAGAIAPMAGSIAVEKRRERVAICPRPPISTGLSRSASTISCRWACGGGPACSAASAAPIASAIEEALSAVGLTGFERRPIGSLSGGQMQRALFARLLLQDAGVILLDEPLTAIDARTAADLLDLVRRWHGEQRTVVAVLHDIDTVRTVFPEALLIAREAVAWGTTADVLTPANLLKARRMLEAHDPHAGACARAA